MNQFTFSPVATVSSCFKEKFATPRQPGLVPDAWGALTLLPSFDSKEMVRGLEGFSHIWVVFVFHAIPEGEWNPTVRPPRLGGKKRLGVFATRSTHRPNPIGLSVLKLERVQADESKVSLEVSGCDLLDGTPVLDIKPYLPYADAVTDAHGSYASDMPPQSISVRFTGLAERQCHALESDQPRVKSLICQMLMHDPRPAYLVGRSGERIYATRLHNFDLRWWYPEVGVAEVLELQ